MQTTIIDEEEEDIDDNAPKKKKRMGLIHLSHNFKAMIPKR